MSSSSSPKPAGECDSVRSSRREKSCTSLLHDPAGVLSDRKRWPDHLCGEEFLAASTRLWSGSDEWPLPLGDGRRLVWVLTVRRRRSKLELFVFEDPNAPDDGHIYCGPLTARFGCVEDLSPLPVLENARKWWRHVSVKKIPSGRPKGSGTFESREHLLQAVATANRALREQGKTITQPAVAELLHISTRRLQQLNSDGMTWDELIKL
jgi:hypothetical protein